jgi:hypothetical protein
MHLFSLHVIMRPFVAKSTTSRATFFPPDQTTLADLIARIRADSTLPPAVRQNWSWAIRLVGRLAGRDVAAISAHPDHLRRVLAQLSPGGAGVSAAVWANARSLIAKSLNWAGMADMPGRYQGAFAPRWAQLWSKLPANTALAYQLSRLMHFCSANDIAPEAVTDEVLAAMLDAMVEESLIRHPYAAYRSAARSWNNAVERIPGWPQQRLTVPSRRRLVWLSWDRLMPQLRQEIDTFFQRAARVTLDAYASRPMRPATIRTRREQLRRLASAIVANGTMSRHSRHSSGSSTRRS